MDAADRSWTGGTIDWNTGTNWGGKGGKVPGNIDNAVFNGTFTNQPNVSASTNPGGIWMTNTVGQNVTISANAGTTITLQGNTINGTAGLGILVDNTNAFTLTISAPLKIGAAQTWTNSSSNLFTLSGTLDLNSQGLTINGAGNTTISGLVSNAGAFTKAGSGKLTLSNTGDTYSGQLTVQAGTLSIDTINNASANGELGNNALAVILGSSGATGTLEYTGGTASSTKKFTMATGGMGTFQVDTAGTTVTLSGLIDGSGALSKTGSGTLVFSGANSYTGLTTVSAGVLNIQNATGLGTTASGTTVSSGATLQLQGGITVGAEALTVSGTGASGQNGALVNTGGTNNYGGLLTLGAATTISSDSGTLNLTNAGTITGATFGLTLTGSGNGSVSSVIGTTSGTLTKSGSGTWTLSGANTYTGGTTVNGGTLTLGASSGSALASTSSVTVNSGGTLLLGANDQINNSATMTLAGGTFAKGNFSEGTTGSVGVGALTLTASGSHIDFGTGTVGVLTFASLNVNTFMLTIDNWTGNYNQVGSASTDRLIFDSDQSANLADFYFTGYGAGGVEFALGGGFFEVVAAVPEPSTWVAAILVFGVVVYDWRRRFISHQRARGRIPFL
jgi:fibronectin-binding autotransporter adhesin